jgi:putative tricarboxylic transport membrane protein
MEILQTFLTLQSLIALMVGVLGGMLIGALPGLGATMGVALLIPITYGMEPTAALIMLTSIYTSAIYGGSITAILIHTPGTPASAATAADGYALTLQGKGLEALGASTICSMIGGTISAIALMTIAPPLAGFSLRFSAAEYFLIAIFGLTIIGSLAGDNMLKGLLSGIFGLALGLIGYDVSFGVARFTYRITALESGIQLVPALIGMFSISQVMIQAEKIGEIKKIADTRSMMQGKFFPSWKGFAGWIPNIIRSSIIGVIVGILPGAGGDIGSWVSYNEAKRFSKHPEKFGKGATEGVVASETANNAVTGGALIPLLTLGIPGSGTAAVLLGGLMLQGLAPGHSLFSHYAGITYSILLGFLVANILMGLVGMLIAKYVAKVANVDIGILAPVIVILSIVGAYAINMSVLDVSIMVIFGFIGYWMRKFGFATAPVILGIILGPMAENGFVRAQMMAKGQNMFIYYLSRPVCVVLIVLIIIGLLMPLFMSRLQKRIAASVDKHELADIED